VIPFEQASYLSQVRRLRALALDVVLQYPLKVKSIDFIKHGANATFKVTTPKGKKYLLRICSQKCHSKNALLEEFKWLNSISQNTNIRAPKPVNNKKGQTITSVKHPSIGESRNCVLFDWVQGHFLWKRINADYAHSVGALMGQLQKSGLKIQMKHRDYWRTRGLVGTTDATYYNVERLTGISKTHQHLITSARRLAHKMLLRYENSYPDKIGIIHADLNPNNCIIQDKNYGAIDFDDCGIGFYGYDLAVPLFSFEHLTESDKSKDFSALKEALFEGYSQHMPLTQHDIEMSPYFLLALKLMIVAWLESLKYNSRLRPFFKTAVHRTIKYFKKLQK